MTNIDKVGELFPGVITETVDADGNPAKTVDFDLLRQELSDHVVDGPQERYQLDWPGKRAALFAANAPIAKTLRPDRAESVDFEATTNVFIEGDNLDALKLLQEPYLGKIKLIYIDPPYNTGNDFVYEDDFAETAREYLARSGQADDAGAKLVANTESNGRFHSDWLSMMYPRLKLARNLLTDDGVIFMSIDDTEVANLRAIANEIFGAHNFIATFKWNKTSKAPTLSKLVRNKYEYILAYSRGETEWLRGVDSYNTAAPLLNSGNPHSVLAFKPGNLGCNFKDGLYEAGLYGTAEKGVELLDDLVVAGQRNVQTVRIRARFKWTQNTVDSRMGEGVEIFIKTPKLTTIYYSLSTESGKFIAPSDLISDSEVGVKRNDEAYTALRELFDGRVMFDYSKPVSLLKYLVRAIPDDDFTVLDFFAGSGTTAHAVMELNAEDGGNRRWIMIQLDEAPAQGSEAAKAGFLSIADIARNRIMRAGVKVRTARATDRSAVDLGFRSLRIDTTNMADVLRRPDETAQDALTGLESNVKPDRTSEDLLFQVLLDWGLDLALPITVEKIDGHDVYVVDDDALIACFDVAVDSELIRGIAKREPLRAVFLDSGFATDDSRINAEQIFNELSPVTDMKAI